MAPHIPLPATALPLGSTVQTDATLTVDLESVPVPVPGPDDVLVQIQAAPINPSDIGLPFGTTNLSTLATSGTVDRPVACAAPMSDVRVSVRCTVLDPTSDSPRTARLAGLCCGIAFCIARWHAGAASWPDRTDRLHPFSDGNNHELRIQ
jgi:hypothetical protein